jgi:hypothetical protein
MLEATMFPRKLASNFYFLTFVFHFMLDPEQALFLCRTYKPCTKITQVAALHRLCLPRIKSSDKTARSIKPI